MIRLHTTRIMSWTVSESSVDSSIPYFTFTGPANFPPSGNGFNYLFFLLVVTFDLLDFSYYVVNTGKTDLS